MGYSWISPLGWALNFQLLHMHFNIHTRVKRPLLLQHECMTRYNLRNRTEPLKELWLDSTSISDCDWLTKMITFFIPQFNHVSTQTENLRQGVIVLCHWIWMNYMAVRTQRRNKVCRVGPESVVQPDSYSCGVFTVMVCWNCLVCYLCMWPQSKNEQECS